MAFIVQEKTVLDSNGLRVPANLPTARPSNPTTGMVIFNTATNILEIYDQGFWKDATQDVGGSRFLYRQVITTGYVAGGYANSSPWRNVNRMAAATDVMTNLGDLLDIAANYTSGACSRTKAFMWGAGPSWDSATQTTVGFNMITETGSGLNAAWNMAVSRNDCGTIFKEHEYCFITGGGSAAVDIFNFTLETMRVGLTAGQAGDVSYQYGVSAFSDETVGYWWGTGGQKLTFATETTYTVGTAGNVNVNGQQKGISSKLNRGYLGNEGTYNGGYNLRRYETVVDSYYTIGKPIGNSGEENFDMGQAHQYMMGMYDGAQNNRGWKFRYYTDSGFELGSGSTRTGVPGGSSGHCFWKG